MTVATNACLVLPNCQPDSHYKQPDSQKPTYDPLTIGSWLNRLSPNTEPLCVTQHDRLMTNNTQVKYHGVASNVQNYHDSGWVPRDIASKAITKVRQYQLKCYGNICFRNSFQTTSIPQLRTFSPDIQSQLTVTTNSLTPRNWRTTY